MDKTEYRIGRFTLHPFRQLLDAGRPVSIKPKALAVLSVLAEANGALVTKKDLMAAVWPHITVEDNALQAHIASLRKTMGCEAELLSTVHGYGYRLACAPASPLGEIAPKPSALPMRRRWRIAYALLAAALLLIAALASLWLSRDRAAKAPKRRSAQAIILPFDIANRPAVDFANRLRDRIPTQHLTDSSMG